MSKETIAFTKDIQSFVNYLGDKQLPLTEAGYLKRKDISQINDLFTWPYSPWEESLRKEFVARARSEYQIECLHFIRVLCEVSGLVKIRNKKLSATAKIKKFLTKNSGEQLSFLFNAWVSKLNWSYFARTDTDIIECLQDKQLSFLFNLQILRGMSVPFEAFVKTLIDAFPLADFQTDEQFDVEIKQLFSFLRYFGIAEIQKRKDKFGFFDDYSFSVTAQGQKLIQDLLRKQGVETNLTARALKLLNQTSNN